MIEREKMKKIEGSLCIVLASLHPEIVEAIFRGHNVCSFSLHGLQHLRAASAIVLYTITLPYGEQLCSLERVLLAPAFNIARAGGNTQDGNPSPHELRHGGKPEM